MNEREVKRWNAREPQWMHTLGPLNTPIQPEAVIEVSESDFDSKTSQTASHWISVFKGPIKCTVCPAVLPRFDSSPASSPCTGLWARKPLGSRVHTILNELNTYMMIALWHIYTTSCGMFLVYNYFKWHMAKWQNKHSGWKARVHVQHGDTIGMEVWKQFEKKNWATKKKLTQLIMVLQETYIFKSALNIFFYTCT